MKISEALKVIDDGWVKKPEGFRVHFQKQEDSEWVTEYSPGEKQKALDSDVVAWRLAWKLAEARKSDTPENDEKNQQRRHARNRPGYAAVLKEI